MLLSFWTKNRAGKKVNTIALKLVDTAIMTQQQPRQNDEESQVNSLSSEAGSERIGAGNRSTVTGTPISVLRDQKLLDRLVLAAGPELLTTDEEQRPIVNLATLQRMLIFQHQVDILDKLVPLVSRQFGGENPLKDEGLRRNLTDYVRAIRDWEVMVDHQKKAGTSTTGDPFHISGRWPLTATAIQDRGLQPGNDAYAHGNLNKLIGTFDQRSRVNKRRNLKAMSARFITTMSGGLLLVGPMLLMVYHKDLNTSTATTSVAVIFFAVVMSFFTNATPEVAVGAVAAYAAVLVVFVGTIFQDTG
ncbi:hypothetical protein V8F06_008177 [Rhypophila decipiens]